MVQAATAPASLQSRLVTFLAPRPKGLHGKGDANPAADPAVRMYPALRFSWLGGREPAVIRRVPRAMGL